MISPLYYPNQTRIPIRQPEHIILDTAPLIKRLRAETAKLQEVDAEETEIIELVIQALMFRLTAHEELDYSCMEVVQKYLGCSIATPYFKSSFMCDIEEIVKAIRAFGLALYDELERLDAYTNGYLFYQYLQMTGADVVLVRTQPPDL